MTRPDGIVTEAQTEQGDEFRDCPVCGGSGEVLDHINYWGMAENQPCVRCGGTGEVDL
jgi:DnaJ-class molecular chaperone